MNASASSSGKQNVAPFWWSVVTSPLFEIAVILLVIAVGSLLFHRGDQRKGPSTAEVVQGKGS